jgi:hypothetical protein
MSDGEAKPGNPRSVSTLQPPDPKRNYEDFPVYKHRARVRRSRAHGARNPWYFSNQPGRFNLESPRGTLNTASTKEVAVREFLGRVLVGDPVIPASAIAGRWISELEVPRVKAADFTAGPAAAFGIVPGDVTAPMDDNYAVTRAWATAMDEAGFGGIQSRSRFGVGANPTCLFVFGDEGEQVMGAIHAKHTMRSVIETMPGYSIDSTPTSGTLIVDP